MHSKILNIFRWNCLKRILVSVLSFVMVILFYVIKKEKQESIAEWNA